MNKRTWPQRLAIGISALYALAAMGALCAGLWRVVLLPKKQFVVLFPNLVLPGMALIGLLAAVAKIKKSAESGLVGKLMDRI